MAFVHNTKYLLHCAFFVSPAVSVRGDAKGLQKGFEILQIK